MSASFPTLSSGAIAKYPLTRSHNFRTAVYIHTDMSEQRYAMGNPLETFVLVFNNVKTADKEIVRTFFNQRLGSFDTTWSFTLQDSTGGPTTYTNLQFVPGQQFDAQNIRYDRWAFSLKVRQTRKQ